MELVRSTTQILVPKPLRNVPPERIRKDGSLDFLVMDYVPGRSLSNCWDDLSWFRKLMVIWQLRQYVIQLRRATAALPMRDGRLQPGPNASEAQECIGRFFTIDVGSPTKHWFLV
jgi:hypothetical protein